MDLMTVLILILLVFSFWFLLSRRMDDIESDIRTLGKATGNAKLLTKMQHRDQN